MRGYRVQLAAMFFETRSKDSGLAAARAGAPPGSARSAGRARTLRELVGAMVVALSGTLFSAACGEIKPAPVGGMAAAPATDSTATASQSRPNSNAQRTNAPRIRLPEMLAVEAPARGVETLAPDASPLRELLGAASSGSLSFTHDQAGPLPMGPTRVTWTARQPGGSDQTSPPIATRSEYVYVFPFGQTPVGVSGDDHATAGNHAAKVARDESGHVHIAWLDAGRQGQGIRVMYRRGRPDPRTGTVVWETEPTRVSDARSEVWNSYVALEASAHAVHLAWWGGRTTNYRRLERRADGWHWAPVQDIGILGAGDDTGPDIAVRGDDEIHVVTPAGFYAVSRDRGATWLREQVPNLGPRVKLPGLAADADGNIHVVFTSLVRGGGESPTQSRNGYWELRYIRRQPNGGWVDAHNVLAAFPEWNDRGAGRDTLADWPDVAVDQRGNIHVVWHGTANTHRYGKDEAFYARRPKTGGMWGAWEQPQALLRTEGQPTVHSFAPALAMDPVQDVVVPVFFFDLAGSSAIFGSMMRAVRSGRIEGPPVPLSVPARDAVARGRLEHAVSVWFPSPASRLTRAGGRVWLDILETVATPEGHASPHIVVYQCVDVTDVVTPSASRRSRAPESLGVPGARPLPHIQVHSSPGGARS